MTNIIVRHLINWERRNNMHKEMESSMFFSIFQLMQFMKYQGMKRMEELDIKPSQAGILFSPVMSMFLYLFNNHSVILTNI